MAVLIEKQYEDDRHINQPVECELQGVDRNGRMYKKVRLTGITTKWALKNNVTSGKSTLFVPSGSDIDDQTNELVISSGSSIEVSDTQPCSA